MSLGKKDLQVPISQDLLKRVLPLLDSSEDISVLLEELLEQEIEKRLNSHLSEELIKPELDVIINT